MAGRPEVEFNVGRAVRNRSRPLYVYVTDAERDRIEALALAAGLSVSSYLRVAATSATIRGRDSLQAARELHRAASDIGRVGGLLKAYLTDAPPPDLAMDIRRLLRELEDGARQVRGAAMAFRP